MSEELKKSNNGKQTKKELELEQEEHKKEKLKKKISKPVILSAEAYKTIILYASRFANQAIPPKEWKEIYGILIGYSDNDFVYVERAEALTVGYDTDVQLDEKHYIFESEIQDKLDEEGKGYFIVGWFHSHPGLGLFFSDIDLINQIGFQGRFNDAVGLVFDHTLLGKKKQEKVENTEHTITKYETGFEIYRMTDITMDQEDPEFINNYYRGDYVVNGLNKFFFANVLSELSALVSAGKPLQSSYGEYYERDSSQTDESKADKPKDDPTLNKGNLVEIPLSEEMIFDIDDFFYDETELKKKEQETQLKEIAEQLIFEGNQAFKVKDAVMGVEKYRRGIEKFKELNNYERVLELLKNLSEHCISSNHLILAEEFAEELYTLAEDQKNLFYRAEGNYLIGYLTLKKEGNEFLEYALKLIQKASIDYEKAGDFAGAGNCYYKIGSIYQTRLNQPYNVCLFYEQAIKSLNDAMIRGHPLRIWAKPEILSQKILELKDIVEELIPNIENPEEREKIKKDLNSIRLNF